MTDVDQDLQTLLRRVLQPSETSILNQECRNELTQPKVKHLDHSITNIYSIISVALDGPIRMPVNELCFNAQAESENEIRAACMAIAKLLDIENQVTQDAITVHRIDASLYPKGIREAHDGDLVQNLYGVRLQWVRNVSVISAQLDIFYDYNLYLRHSLTATFWEDVLEFLDQYLEFRNINIDIPIMQRTSRYFCSSYFPDTSPEELQKPLLIQNVKLFENWNQRQRNGSVLDFVFNFNDLFFMHQPDWNAPWRTQFTPILHMNVLADWPQNDCEVVLRNRNNPIWNRTSVASFLSQYMYGASHFKRKHECMAQQALDRYVDMIVCGDGDGPWHTSIAATLLLQNWLLNPQHPAQRLICYERTTNPTVFEHLLFLRFFQRIGLFIIHPRNVRLIQPFQALLCLKQPIWEVVLETPGERWIYENQYLLRLVCWPVLNEKFAMYYYAACWRWIFQRIDKGNFEKEIAPFLILPPAPQDVLSIDVSYDEKQQAAFVKTPSDQQCELVKKYFAKQPENYLKRVSRRYDFPEQ